MKLKFDEDFQTFLGINEEFIYRKAEEEMYID
jgi:hypothetical protein